MIQNNTNKFEFEQTGLLSYLLPFPFPLPTFAEINENCFCWKYFHKIYFAENTFTKFILLEMLSQNLFCWKYFAKFILMKILSQKFFCWKYFHKFSFAEYTFTKYILLKILSQNLFCWKFFLLKILSQKSDFTDIDVRTFPTQLCLAYHHLKMSTYVKWENWDVETNYWTNRLHLDISCLSGHADIVQSCEMSQIHICV